MIGHDKFRGIGMTSERTRRRLMEQLSQEGIDDPYVLAALSEIPRHHFLEEGIAHRAYENTVLPIGEGQTISQPLMVAQMTQILWRQGLHGNILEIGTGSGYQSAVLSRLWDKVYSIERIRVLQTRARQALLELGLNNIEFRGGDGYLGWSENAPFEAIIVTAAAPVIPPKLVQQLQDGGVMLLPIGLPEQLQMLTLVRKNADEIEVKEIEPVRFVPMLHGVST